MKRFYFLVLCFIMMFCLSGCFISVPVERTNREEEVVPDNVVEEVKEVVHCYDNNGNLFVKYDGNIYFRKYDKDSFEPTALWATYNYKSDVTNKMKIFNTNSEFSDYGRGQFYIIDDKIFSNNKGEIYVSNLEGKKIASICNNGRLFDANEKEHLLFYINQSDAGKLYAYDTRKLTSILLIDESYKDYICIFNDCVYYEEYKNDEKNFAVIIKYDLISNEKVELCKLQDSRTEGDLAIYAENLDYMASCSIDLHYVVGNKLYALVGTREGSAAIFSYGKLYEVDLDSGNTSVIDEGVDSSLVLDGRNLYYTKINQENPEEYVCVNIDTMEKKEDIEGKRYSYAKDGVKLSNSYYGELIAYLSDGTKKEIFSKDDANVFAEKYLSKYSKDEILVNCQNTEIVDGKLFYEIHASVREPSEDIGWREAYTLVGYEQHVYDLTTGEDRVL